MKKHRVKFYSAADLLCGMQLSRSVVVLKQFNINNEYSNINDIIELYNIKKYFDNEIALTIWTAEEKASYIATVKQFPAVIGKYLKELCDDNILASIDSINAEYSSDFWELIDNYKVYQRLSSSIFKKILQCKKILIPDILRHSKIVQHFNNEIKEQLVSSPKYGILLIENYLEAHDNEWQPLCFPDCLSSTEKEALLLAYVQSKDANLNFLNLISKSQGSSDLPLSAKTIHAATKRYREEVNIHFAGNQGIMFSVEVSFSANQAEPNLEIIEGTTIKASYSSIWVKENLDYPTLLNNFIYLFGYVDRMFRNQFVHKKELIGILEKLAGVEGKRDYYTGTAFNQISMLHNLQIMAYDEELKRNGIDLLNIFKWFYETYLLEEFGVSDFIFNVPTENITFFEKCRFITAELESILKQFKLFVEDGAIDHEIFQIPSNHLLFKDVPSMIEKKYLYSAGDKFQRATYCLFSNQCMLKYIKKVNKSYDSFYGLIRSEKIRPDDYSFEKPQLEWLIEQGYICINSSGLLVIASNEVYVLRDLYFNDVTCPSYLSSYTTTILNMVNNGDAYFESTLFSKPEQNYLNYILNRSEFSNGLNLRNSYSHGTQPIASDENAHCCNYYTFLKIIAFITIKINEEFCLREFINTAH